MNTGINRIRLEFKEYAAALKRQQVRSINRIRLEFKVASTFGLVRFCEVLIESDWNLKFMSSMLKSFVPSVLIESDWNLKEIVEMYGVNSRKSINRIRLEFKVCIFSGDSGFCHLY